MFKQNKLTKQQIADHVALDWADTIRVVSTPKYHDRFDTAPIDDATLETKRNKTQMKHEITGKQIWNNVNSGFQKYIMINSEDYKVGKEYNRVLLWDW